MTVTQLVEKSGLKLTRQQKTKAGFLIRNAAKEMGLKYDKVEEVIMVANYPDSFVPEMQNQILKVLNVPTG